jgi:hypothetical protein
MQVEFYREASQFPEEFINYFAAAFSSVTEAKIAIDADIIGANIEYSYWRREQEAKEEEEQNATNI